MREDARALTLRVEELLTCVKRSWPTLADAAGVARPESSRLLSRFVTLCVEEYYRPLS